MRKKEFSTFEVGIGVAIPKKNSAELIYFTNHVTSKEELELILSKIAMGILPHQLEKTASHYSLNTILPVKEIDKVVMVHVVQEDASPLERVNQLLVVMLIFPLTWQIHIYRLSKSLQEILDEVSKTLVYHDEEKIPGLISTLENRVKMLFEEEDSEKKEIFEFCPIYPSLFFLEEKCRGDADKVIRAMITGGKIILVGDKGMRQLAAATLKIFTPHYLPVFLMDPVVIDDVRMIERTDVNVFCFQEWKWGNIKISEHLVIWDLYNSVVFGGKKNPLLANLLRELKYYPVSPYLPPLQVTSLIQKILQVINQVYQKVFDPRVEYLSLRRYLVQAVSPLNEYEKDIFYELLKNKHGFLTRIISCIFLEIQAIKTYLNQYSYLLEKIEFNVEDFIKMKRMEKLLDPCEFEHLLQTSHEVINLLSEKNLISKNDRDLFLTDLKNKIKHLKNKSKRVSLRLIF